MVSPLCGLCLTSKAEDTQNVCSDHRKEKKKDALSI